MRLIPFFITASAVALLATGFALTRTNALVSDPVMSSASAQLQSDDSDALPAPAITSKAADSVSCSGTQIASVPPQAICFCVQDTSCNTCCGGFNSGVCQAHRCICK